MTIDLSPSEAKAIHWQAVRELRFYHNPSWYFGTQEEFAQALADWESIAAKCEALIREAGEWEDHAAQLEILRKA